MEHSNEIIKSILRAEFSDYKENYWHYDREYKLIEKGMSLVNTLNLDVVMPRTLKDEAFAALVSNEDDWVIDAYNAYHKPSGVKYWIANGLLVFKNEGKKTVSIGFSNWIRLYYWIKNVKRKQVIRSVYGA